MPKPKDGRALFELLRSADARGDEAEAGLLDAVPPQPADRPESNRPEPVAPSVRREVRDEGANPPWVEVGGGRLRLALSTQALAVAIFAAGVLLVLAYQVGLRVGTGRGERRGYQAGKMDTQAEVMDDIQSARAGTPVEGLFEGVGTSPIGPGAAKPASWTEPATGAGGEATWVSGYTYVVVQDFRAGAAADVEQAQRYLHDDGIETAIVELAGDWRYRLIATQGFNRDDPVQRKLADEFLARVRQTGQTYFEAGGRYRLEGYLKKLTADHW